MAGKKILFVDDSRTVLCVLRTYLMGSDYEYLVATNGKEGLKTALREQPDLVISDIQMPGISGMDLCKTLRSAPGLRRSKLVLMSSKWTDERQAEANSIGVDRCLQKPVSPEDLVDLVRELLV